MSSSLVTAPGAVAKATDAAKPGADPATTEMFKLKHQIKTVRLSLADTQGRLAVTEQDLSTAATENTQLRSDNTNLRVGLAKAETVAKKSEEELGQRREEVKTLQTARPSSPRILIVGLLFSIVVSSLVGVLLLGLRDNLRIFGERIDEGKTDEKRAEKLRVQVKEAEQRSQALEEEIKRLRESAESSASAPAGSRREKLDNLRRELREARSAAETEKRLADERVQKMQAELTTLSADKQQVEERVQKLEPEVARLTAEKQDLANQVEKLEPEIERLTADKQAAEKRSKELAHDAARLMAEKLRLEHALAKANEKLTFLGQDEPEDTLPPIVG